MEFHIIKDVINSGITVTYVNYIKSSNGAMAKFLLKTNNEY